MISVVSVIDHLLPMLHASSRADLIAPWSDASLTRQANDGLREHARTAGTFVTRNATFITLIQGVIYYALPADLLDVIRVALDGTALVASSTSELEMKDEGFQYTQGPPTDWYLDHGEYHMIGVYPVPDAASAGKHLDLIYHRAPCSFDEAHVTTTLDAPLILGDLLELRALSESYALEGDMRMVETAQTVKQLIDQLYRPGFLRFYGQDQ